MKAYLSPPQWKEYPLFFFSLFLFVDGTGMTSLSRTHARRPVTILSMAVSPVDLVDTVVAAHNHFAVATATAPDVAVAWPSIVLGDEAAGSVGYSKFSYYTTLGLYVLSFPGLWSVVKRATKTK